MNNSSIKKWSKAQLDIMAIDILKKYDLSILTEGKATDIESFIESYLELDIDYKNLSQDDNILGLTTFDDGEVLIYSDDKEQVESLKVRSGNIIIDNSLLEPDIPEGRLRFTLAHEAAHWILHKEIFKDKAYRREFARSEDVAVRDINREDGSLTIKSNIKTPQEWIEWQADYFAGSILMPEKIFKYEFYRILTKDLGLFKPYLFLDNQQCNKENYDYTILNLSNRFKVSKLATRVRLYKLNLLEIN